MDKKRFLQLASNYSNIDLSHHYKAIVGMENFDPGLKQMIEKNIDAYEEIKAYCKARLEKK